LRGLKIKKSGSMEGRFFEDNVEKNHNFLSRKLYI